jgi:DNA-binding response OmpR family regulator
MENGRSSSGGGGASLGEVLVVEDDQPLNELVGAYVQIAGFHYRPALDGESAVRQAHDHPPALIILDIMLPDIDGFEVCKRLKSDTATAGVPVLMLTALTQDEHRRRGRVCGAVDYMGKPFDPEALIAAIRDHATH